MTSKAVKTLSLNNLGKLVKKRKTVGRGGAKGGTCGKGHKGQKARSGGKISAQFEGGQMSLTRRLPKRGFSNFEFKLSYKIINLNVLETNFDSENIINRESLLEKGLIKKRDKLIKVLGNGQVSKKLIIYADAFSDAAREAILVKGGEVHVIKES